MADRKAVTITMDEGVKEKALKAVDEKRWAGINSLSALIELAIVKLLEG